jgi:hypothetical protein
MPADNRFRHQPYHAASPAAPFELIDAPAPIPPTVPEYNENLIVACRPLERANVAAVFLIHGTFVGNDALGALTELRRFAPRLSEGLRKISKGLMNALIGETGNYTPGYAHAFQDGLTQAAGRVIPVELFNWSSQNNHIARADGAVRLIARLAELSEEFSDEQLVSPSPPRVLLWAHSHGGNLLALVTNLLAADRDTRKAFFDAARVFYTPWLTKKADMPAWARVEELLETDTRVRRLPLDIVTFGTPIRYGWDNRGYSHLLHFVNHRPSPHLPHHRTHHPLRLLHMCSATHGDYVHQIGIAGTNVAPLPLAVRTFLADRRLHEVLQSDVSWRELLLNLARGQRIPDEGPTLLVDYHDAGWQFWRHLWGHGVYTRRCWLPFHLAEIAQRFYASAAEL